MKTVTRALAALLPTSGASAPTPTPPAPRISTADAVVLARAYDAGEIASLKSRLAAAQAAATAAQAAAASAAAAAAELQIALNASQEARKSLFGAWAKEVQLAKDTDTRLAEAEAQVGRLQRSGRQVGALLDETRTWALELVASRDAYRALARSARARKGSAFSLPYVAGEVEPAELAFEDRKVIDALCDIAERWEALEAPPVPKERRNALCEYGSGPCRLCRRHKRRGHRNGRVPMGARETYHYLNR